MGNVNSGGVDGHVPENVLVTGGGGFLGSHIVRALVARGDRVRIFARGAYPELEALGVEICRGSLHDAEAVRRACVGRDIVFHVAAKVGIWGKREAFHQTNVVGTEHVLEACRQEGVRRLIHTSSPSVIFDGSEMEGVDESLPYPRRFSAHYPATKAEAEKRVLAALDENLRGIILRPHLIWGPGDPHLVPRLLKKAPTLRIVGRGTNLVDSLYIDNAVQGHIRAGDALRTNEALSGRIYFLAQGEVLPLWDLINRILEAGGRPKVTRSIPYGVAYALGAVFEGLYTLLGMDGEPPMTRFVAGELAKSHYFDLSAARRDLGYSPTVDLEEGLQRLRAWLEESGEGTLGRRRPGIDSTPIRGRG